MTTHATLRKYYFCIMKLIDSHTHLYVEQFDVDREVVIERAFASGVEQFLIPAINSNYYQRMQALQQLWPERIHLMAGLHPNHVKEDYENELSIVETELDTKRYCAVGEIGIDLYWDQKFLKKQQVAFALQIEWAIDRDLPIVIHCREAFDEVFEILETFDSNQLKGIFHCFTGNLQQAQRVIDNNLLLGIGGVVTFKNGKIDQFLSEISLECLALETDAPYLAPSPHRGKRNESSYLGFVLERVSEIYKINPTEVARVTSANVQRVFTSISL